MVDGMFMVQKPVREDGAVKSISGGSVITTLPSSGMGLISWV